MLKGLHANVLHEVHEKPISILKYFWLQYSKISPIILTLKWETNQAILPGEEKVRSNKYKCFPVPICRSQASIKRIEWHGSQKIHLLPLETFRTRCVQGLRIIIGGEKNKAIKSPKRWSGPTGMKRWENIRVAITLHVGGSNLTHATHGSRTMHRSNDDSVPLLFKSTRGPEGGAYFYRSREPERELSHENPGFLDLKRPRAQQTAYALKRVETINQVHLS